MSAPLHNTFWQLREKHGRDATFSNGSELWDVATEYFEWCDANPWMKIEQLKKPFTYEDEEGKIKIQTVAELPTARPYTLKGFCLFCSKTSEWWSRLKKTKALDEDFSQVITRIEEIIYTQKFEGAVVGAFNANIIARDLGLVDKVEKKVLPAKRRVTRDEQGNIVITYDDAGESND